jgi:hypothetical protein
MQPCHAARQGAASKHSKFRARTFVIAILAMKAFPVLVIGSLEVYDAPSPRECWLLLAVLVVAFLPGGEKMPHKVRPQPITRSPRLNPAGMLDTSSTVTPLLNSTGETVAYLAQNPNAQYIQAGSGALANAGRNTLQMPAIQNLDFSIFKNFGIGEGSKKIQLRADLYNALNHPQYVPGSVNGVQPIATTGVSQFNTVGQADFDVASHVFTSHPRVIQLAVRFNF